MPAVPGVMNMQSQCNVHYAIVSVSYIPKSSSVDATKTFDRVF